MILVYKSTSGVDNVANDEIKDYVNQNWKDIKRQIETRSYKPQPVKRIEIPKPSYGVRKLGVNHGRARQISYISDRYQFVITKTCVVYAVAKEILAHN